MVKANQEDRQISPFLIDARGQRETEPNSLGKTIENMALANLVKQIESKQPSFFLVFFGVLNYKELEPKLKNKVFEILIIEKVCFNNNYLTLTARFQNKFAIIIIKKEDFTQLVKKGLIPSSIQNLPRF